MEAEEEEENERYEKYRCPWCQEIGVLCNPCIILNQEKRCNKCCKDPSRAKRTLQNKIRIGRPQEI